jgi:hypothetical protein
LLMPSCTQNCLMVAYPLACRPAMLFSCTR